MALTLFPKNAADVCAAKRTEKTEYQRKVKFQCGNFEIDTFWWMLCGLVYVGGSLLWAGMRLFFCLCVRKLNNTRAQVIHR